MSLTQHLSGHTTVQASAGSGKTYLLISRIVRLLLTGAKAENILSITFTRKAANEMQTRLLERLYELAICDDKTLTTQLNELELKPNPQLIHLSRNLYEKILRSESSVKTLTFHAFCQELLQRFPMEAQVPPGFELLDKSALLYNKAWDMLMAEADKNKNKSIGQSLQFLFKELGLYNSKQALLNFIEHRSDWWAYTWNQKNIISYAKKRLEKQLNVNTDIDPIEELFSDKKLMQQLSSFNILLCKHETKTNIKHSEFIYKVINESISLKKRFQNFLNSFLTRTGEPFKNRKATSALEKKLGSKGQEQFLELHQVLSGKLIQTKANISALRVLDISGAWYVAGEHYLAHYQKLKKEQRLLDFTDLEWQAYLLLNKNNNALWIQYKLDQRIEHLLIDEFQDTNPTQWQLILPLLEEIASSEDERQRSVFIVGDEKQSIYRFRRADPRLFIAAEEWLRNNLNATTSYLSHSWRSSPAIINFVNKVFTQPEFKKLLPNFIKHETNKKYLSGQVILLPLSMKEHTQKNTDSDLKITLRNPLNEPRLNPGGEEYFNEGLLIAKQINNLISNKFPIYIKNGYEAINYSDITLLLRSRTHVAEYERALRQSSIPYIGAKRGALLESLEINDMLDLLQWLILPYNNLSLAGILRSPIFSISNDELILIKQEENGNWFERLYSVVKKNQNNKKLSRAYELLLQWQTDANKLPVHDLLDKIYSEANVIACYISAFPQHLSQRVTANLNRFLELTLEMDSGRYPSLSRFYFWLNELRQTDKDAPDEPVTSATEGTDKRVKILTIHEAKGLEAPVIFLVDSANSPVDKNAYSTLIDWPTGNDKPEYFLLTATKSELDDFSKKCLSEQKYFQQRESANILYVALTRAKQMLYISASEPHTKDHGWYQKICDAFDCNGTELNEPLTLEKTGDKNNIKETEIKEKTISITVDKNLSTALNIKDILIDISPSQFSSANHKIDQTDESNTNRGIIMHQMLNKLSHSPESIFSHFYSPDLKDTKSDILEDWWNECKNIINNDVFISYFNPSYYDRCYNEVAIQFKDNGSNVYGIIDRLIIKDKIAIILDYKTHPYVTKENINSVAMAYEKQMQLYKKGVQLLWPEYSVTSILLFTAIAKEYSF